MAEYLMTGELRFGATAGDPATNPGTASFFSGSGPIYDSNDDGNIDPSDYHDIFDVYFSGWTVTINGNDYAVFSEDVTPWYFYIPFNSAIDDISGFTDPSQWTFQYVGENAVVANCFLTGTQIATPTGERKVEDLQIGDLILTALGDAIPVKWIGRQSFRNNILNLPLAADRAPICIAKGALGMGLPTADLYVTADHGMIIDDLLVNAGALVNGTTIRRVLLSEMDATFTVYHIETEHHDVIFANGAPAESFIDYIDRKTFDNHDEYAALYGDEPVITEMPLPRISSRRQLPTDIAARFGIADFGADVTAEATAFLQQRKAG
ncbi:Hint domain-containing protein [Thioclava sp. FR2]|uniref:Hint domain-containing protein n=1 Tax=Thioclava sp. FR2 TaxID=3445780 RepID=UPI003EBCADFE